MGGAMKYFMKKLLDHEKFRSMVSWALKIFLKNLENPPAPPLLHIYRTLPSLSSRKSKKGFFKKMKLGT